MQLNNKQEIMKIKISVLLSLICAGVQASEQKCDKLRELTLKNVFEPVTKETLAASLNLCASLIASGVHDTFLPAEARVTKQDLDRARGRYGQMLTSGGCGIGLGQDWVENRPFREVALIVGNLNRKGKFEMRGYEGGFGLECFFPRNFYGWHKVPVQARRLLCLQFAKYSGLVLEVEARLANLAAREGDLVSLLCMGKRVVGTDEKGQSALFHATDVAVAAHLLSIRDANGKPYSACRLNSKDNFGKTSLDTIKNREVIEYLKTTAKAEGIALLDQGTSGNLSKSVRECTPAEVSKKIGFLRTLWNAFGY